MPKQEIVISGTETTFDVIQKQADEVGLSMRELCRRAGVDRSAVDKWKPKEPKTLRTLRKLMQVIEAERNRKAKKP